MYINEVIDHCSFSHKFLRRSLNNSAINRDERSRAINCDYILNSTCKRNGYFNIC